MKICSFQRLKHCSISFFVLAIIIGYESSTLAETSNSTAGQEPPSVHSVEQQIQTLYTSASKAVVRIDRGESQEICTSGVIVSDDGYVLSREQMPLLLGKLVKVHLSNGRTASAKTLGRSSEWGISVSKIVDEGVWPHVEIGSTKEASVGQPCVVIGYALRGDTKYDRAPSVRYGAIEQLDASNWLTTTCVGSAVDSPPIFSMDGKLLGIVVNHADFKEVATAVEVFKENWDDLAAGKNLDWIRYPPRKDSIYRPDYDSDWFDADKHPAPDEVIGPARQTRKRSPDLAAAKKIAHDTTVRLVYKSQAVHRRWSGVIVSEEGHILTCGHSRQVPGERITVSLSDGRDFDGVVLGTNFVSDVGLAKIKESGTWPFAKIVASSLLAPGDPVVICGYPAAASERKPTVTAVAVQQRRPYLFWEYDLPFTSYRGRGGMSGGGVFDSKGHYVGVNQGPRATRSEVAKVQWEHLAGVEPFPPLGKRPHSVIRQALVPQADKSAASVVEIVVGSEQVALGTIVRADGWIVTKASRLTDDAKCKLSDGRLLSAELQHVVREHDLAFLKVDAEDLPVTSFLATQSIKAGAIVAAVLPGELPRCGVVSVETRSVPAEKSWAGDGLSDTPRGIEVTQVSWVIQRDAAQRPKDIILEVNGHSTPDIATLKRLLGQELKDTIPGDLIEMKVTRSGREMTFETPLPPSDRYWQQAMDSSFTLRRSGFAAVFDSDIPLKKSLCGGPVIDASGQVVGIVIASRGRSDELRGPTMVLSASIVKAVTGRILCLPESPSTQNRNSNEAP